MDELVKALRCCGSMIIDCKKHCPYYGKENCSARKDADAADAIEKLQKESEQWKRAWKTANKLYEEMKRNEQQKA